MRAWPGVARRRPRAGRAGCWPAAGCRPTTPTDPSTPTTLGGLADTTTTSTTTTSTLPPQTTTTIEPTTTTLPTTEPVTLYFVDGNQQLAAGHAGGHDPGIARDRPGCSCRPASAHRPRRPALVDPRRAPCSA